MALLVEGLGVGGDTSLEEYIIGPDNDIADNQDPYDEKDQIKLYAPEEGLSWIARPVAGQSTLGLVSRHGSMASRSGLVDPLVTLFGSVHEKLPETGSMRSMLFPHFGSMFSVGGNQTRQEEWDEESLAREGEECPSDAAAGDSDDNLQSPLISRQTTSLDKDLGPPPHDSLSSVRHGSLAQGKPADPVSSMGIGGGWQLAWKWSEREGKDGQKEGGFKRIYLHQDGVPGSQHGSIVSVPGGDAPADSEFIHAAALVSQPALYSAELMHQKPVGPAMVHPSEAASKGPIWRDLFEPGVKHALFVGVGIQILQQVYILSTNEHLCSANSCCKNFKQCLSVGLCQLACNMVNHLLPSSPSKSLFLCFPDMSWFNFFWKNIKMQVQCVLPFFGVYRLG